ncbi:MAG: tetratricopeptide repeat protein, partial [Prochlorotrichaceae cyanobacterium]
VAHHDETRAHASPEPVVYPASRTTATPDPQDTLLEEDFLVEEDSLPPVLDPMPPRSLSLAELEAQIEVLRSQEAPLAQMAQAHLNLGRYYRQQIEQGDSQTETLLGAIAAYEQVLEWLCFSEVSPQEMGDVVWPDILNDLGTLYWLASRTPLEGSDAQGYLQQAVQAYQLGLKKIDEQAHPRSYAMLQNNLGTVFSDLAQWGEALPNLEKAVVAYQAALRYRRPDTDPLKFAATQNNLGTAYWHLAQHTDMTENLKQAINAYNQALRYYRPDREPNSYAMIQNNLGTAYWNLSQCNPVDTFGLSPAESHTQPDRRDWLLLAVNAYQSALRFRTIDTAAAAYAATQNNLGTAYWHLANLAGDQTATVRSYLKLSIEAYQAALKAADKVNTGDSSALSFDRYATHNNLGLILYQSAMLKDPKDETFQPSENQLASALHHHLQALKGWQNIADLYQTALTAVVQTIRTCYEVWGTAGQNRALNQVPGSLLAEVLSKL